MSDKPNTPDQADVVAQLEQANADLATARQTIGTLQTQVAAITAERDTANASLATANTSLATVTTERDTLQTANAKLEADMKDFNVRVAAEVVKLGIRPGAVEQKPQAERKLTATEKCMAAKAATATK